MVMAIPITGVATVKITTYPAPNRPPVSCQPGREKNDGLLRGLKKSIRKRLTLRQSQRCSWLPTDPTARQRPQQAGLDR